MTRRFVVTGPPGCGKTAALALVGNKDIQVVPEAATEVVQGLLDDGVAHPEQHPDFIARIVALQRSRRLAADRALQLHDRSVFCTLTLARYLNIDVPDELQAELAEARHWFEPIAIFFEPLGDLTPTPVRRISYRDALVFGDLRRQTYREHGFDLLNVPVATPEERAQLVRDCVTR